jgi:hypothetical protein
MQHIIRLPSPAYLMTIQHTVKINMSVKDTGTSMFRTYSYNFFFFCRRAKEGPLSVIFQLNSGVGIAQSL